MQLNAMPMKEEIGIKTILDVQTTLALISYYDKEKFILYPFWCTCGKLWGGCPATGIACNTSQSYFELNMKAPS